MRSITVSKAASHFVGLGKLSLLSHPVTLASVHICLFEKPAESPLFKPSLACGDEMLQTGRVHQLKQHASAQAACFCFSFQFRSLQAIKQQQFSVQSATEQLIFHLLAFKALHFFLFIL